MVYSKATKRECLVMKDPVCGMKVNEKNEPIEHNGKKYYFCCASCRWAFEKNPEQFTES